MLILTRRISETLVIGDDTFLTVLGVTGNQVRFGIAAPLDVPVHREEIYLRIQAGTDALIGAGGKALAHHQTTTKVSSLTH